MQDESLLSALVELILPHSFVDYFKVVAIQQEADVMEEEIILAYCF